MNELKPKPAVLDIRIRLAGLWAGLMFLYVYCDLYSLYRPGHLGDMAAGRMGSFEVSQISLLVAGLLMILPAVMVPISLLLNGGLAIWVNLAVAGLYTLVNFGNLAGETWAYYWAFGAVEMAITLAIAVLAIRELRKSKRENPPR